MKYFLSSFVLLVLMTGCATTELPTITPEEMPSEEPFQGANTILLQSGADVETLRGRVVSALRSNDYEVSQPTLSEQTMATEPRSFGSGVPGSARYFFRLPDSAGQPVQIYGRWIAQKSPDRHSFQQFEWQPVMPRGDRRSTAWMAWLAMQELAESFRGGTIMYDQRDR